MLFMSKFGPIQANIASPLAYSQNWSIRRLVDYSGYALMKLLSLGITNKFVLLSLTRNFHRLVRAKRVLRAQRKIHRIFGFKVFFGEKLAKVVQR